MSQQEVAEEREGRDDVLGSGKVECGGCEGLRDEWSSDG